MKHHYRRRIHRVIRVAAQTLLCSALLLGLIPPPLVLGVLPKTARDFTEVLLPQPYTAFAQTVDYGDLPTAAQSGFASDYPTTSASNGASHNVAAILRIGAQIDGEGDGQPSANADGDDSAGTPDDEDGVQVKTPLRPGEKGVIVVGLQQPLNSTAYVSGWFDFNQDGDFEDSGEQIANDVLSTNGGVRTDTSHVLLDFAVPANASTGFTYARFRFCSTANSCNAPVGAVSDGEVEDYRVEIAAVAQLGNLVWLDTNGDGVQQGGEAGIEGVFVKLFRASDDALVGVTATDAAGLYSFANVLPGTYYLEFVAPSGYTFTAAQQGAATSDSDADQTTGRTGNIVLAAGANDQDWDAGLMTSSEHLTYCEALPLGPTEINHTFSLPKFDPALGTLTGVSVSDYVGLQQWLAAENRAANPQNVRIVSASDAFLTLPDSTFLSSSVGLNTGFKTYDTYDGISDATGSSSFSYADWQYDFTASSTNYGTLADFIAASPGQTINLPFETLSGFTTTGGGGNVAAYQRTYAIAGVCVDYSYEPATPGTITVVKNTVGSDGTFTFSSVDSDLGGLSIATTGNSGSSSAFAKSDGVYTISEDLLNGWTLSSVAVTGDPENNSNVDINNRSATISLDNGENIQVIFRNSVDSSPPFVCSDETLVYSADYPLAKTNWSVVQNLPQFDPALGTLQAVRVTGSVLISNTTALESMDAAPSVIGATANGSATLSDPFGNLAPASVSESLGTFNASAFDGTVDFAGTSGKDLPGMQASSSSSFVLTGAQMAPYIGTGDIAFTMEATGNTFSYGAANLLTFARTDAAGDVTVAYCYEPVAAIPGTITIVKNTVGSDGTFTFSSADGDLDGISITTESNTGSSEAISKAAGSYAITEDALPAGWSLSSINITGDTDAGSTSNVNGRQVTIDLDEGEDIVVTFTNAELPVSIGSYVWEDENANGIQDSGEPALEGATVSLLVDDGTGSFVAARDISDVLVDEYVTGADGLYFFDNLPPGDYKVQVRPPAGYLASPVQNDADNDETANDSNIAVEPVAGTYESAIFTLTVNGEPTETGAEAGDNQDNLAEDSGNMTVDFGFVPRLSIGNRVWLDANVNGTDDGGTEAGVEGVTVTLYEAGNLATALGTTLTNEDGFYRFDNLAPGSYVVAILADQFDDSADPLYGLVSTINSGAGPDQNDNGVGTNPTSGLYSTAVVLEANGAPTAEPSAPGNANAETLAAGDVAGDANYDATIDFGFTSLSLGNRIWLDLNGDGIDNDANNAPPAPVTVNLYLASAPNALLLSTTTTAAGYYRFDHLLAGSYIVEIPATQFQSGGPLESWWSTITGSVSENVDLNDNGINPAIPTSIRTNGIRSSAVSLGVALEPTGDTSADTEDTLQTDVAPDVNYDATVDFGFVQLSLGNRIWEDANFDGLDDGSEPGFEGVIVNLLYADGETPVLDAADEPISTVTNAQGYYRFDGLPPGDYVVQIPASEFQPGEPLAGWRSTTDGGTVENTDQDDNGVDPLNPNDVLTDGLLSGVVTLATGQEPQNEASLSGDTQSPPLTDDANYDATVDFGFVQMSLGNRVWEDVDGDGTDNGGAEPGFDQVVVNLYSATDPNTLLDSTTTDPAGYYRFDNLAPGSYVVEIDPANFADGAVLADWWSTTTTGTPENEDQDDNGIDEATVANLQANGIRSAAISLTLGSEDENDPSNSGQPNGETLEQTAAAADKNYDATVDFGFVRMSLGNRIWIDADGDGTDNGGAEAGAPTVTLNLLQADGETAVVDSTGAAVSTTTDGNGYYRFDNLAPGTYVVQIPASQFDDPADALYLYVSTTTNDVDTLDQNDNGQDNPAPGINGIVSNPVTLTPNQEPTEEASANEPVEQPGAADDQNYDASIDFGFLPPMSIGNRIWADVDGDGTDNGGGEPGFENVTVNLYSTDDLETPLLTMQTDANGYYRFDGLSAGDYVVEIPASNFDSESVLYQWWSTTTGAASENVDQDDNGLDPLAPSDIITDGVRSAVVSLTRNAENEGDPSNAPAETLDQTGAAEDVQYDATVDFGFVRMSLGNRLWEDYNGNGLDDDDALVGDTNAGFEGVLVNLYLSSAPTQTIATAVTDINGYYRFDMLPPGEYIVEIPSSEFQSGEPLENWWSTTTNGAENVDLNDDGGNNTNPRLSGVNSGPVLLEVGSEPQQEGSNGDGGQLDQTGVASDPNYDATVDFGFVQMSLGNRIWLDLNGNGLDDDADNAPRGPVTVALLTASGTPVRNAAGNDRTTVTNPDGYYRFDGLEPGTYIVEIPADQFDGADDALYLYSSTIDDVNGAVDVEQNDNGIGLDSRGGLRSAPVVLQRGNEPTGELSNAPAETLEQAGAAADINYNATVDFGFVPPMSLGNRIWLDFNGNGLDDDAENAPAGPVQVNLLIVDPNDGSISPALNGDGDLITTETSADGYYRFDGLAPAQYMVEIPATQFDEPGDPLYNWFSTITTPTDGVDQNDDGIDEPNLEANGIRTASVTLTLAGELTNEPGGDGDLASVGAADDNNYDASVDLGFVRRDFGDLPNAAVGGIYPTALTEDGPRHIYDGVTFLGAGVDAELDGQPNNAASGDDGGLPGDDEEGVTFGELEPQTTLLIQVTASAPGYLNAWIDFEADGLDQIAYTGVTGGGLSGAGTIADLNLPAAGLYTFEVNTPLVVADTVFTRFRFSAEEGQATTPTGEAASGEVEDHLITTIRRDHGDLPDGSTAESAPDYATTLVDDGARHIILSEGNPYLGAGVDFEPDGQPNVRADGDDNADTTVLVNDEDGVTFDTPMMPDQPYQIAVVAGTDGVLNAWIDFNGDGVLDASEQIATEQAVTAGPVLLTGTAPAVVADALYSRFRFTQNAGEATAPTGEAPNGEVEDYVLMSLGNVIWRDNGVDGAGAPVGIPHNGQQEVGEVGIPGVVVELYHGEQTPGVDTPIATTTTGPNGEYLFTGLPSGDYVVHVAAENFDTDAVLDNYVSSNDEANGVGEDPDSVSQDGDDNGVDDVNRASNGISSHPITLTYGQEPSEAVDGNGLNSNLTVDFGFVQYDFGDLPDASSAPANTYPVTLADDGARHLLDGVTFLGAGVDAEPDGQPSLAADGDDSEAAPSDEDGVTFDTPIMPEQPYQITVNASVPGFLNGWIDFNGDGTFDANEQIALDEPLVAGDNLLSLTAPEVVTTGALYSRFRFSSDDPEQSMLPSGAWNNGEVEDYVLLSLGNTVWADDGGGNLAIQNNGFDEGAELGIRDVVVQLFNAADDPLTAAPLVATTTNALGNYSFTGLNPGEYVVYLPAENFAPGAPLFGYTSSDDELNNVGLDQDLNPSDRDDNGVDPTDPTAEGIRSLPVTLSPDDEPISEDQDTFSNLEVDFGLIPLVSVGNLVWFDVNADGVQGDGEPPVADAVVELLNADGTQAIDFAGNVVLPYTTLADGLYAFGNLLPGEYKIRVTPPAEYGPTRTAADADPDTNGANDDSNGLPTGVGNVVESPLFVLAHRTEPTETDQVDQPDGAEPFGLPDDHSNLTVDFGFIQTVSLGNYVWEDRNANGLQDDGEPGVAGAAVTLLQPDGTPANDANGAPLAPITTTVTGFYNFGNLLPGSYLVAVTPPRGYLPTWTPEDADADTNPANDDSNGLPTGEGASVRSREVLLLPTTEPVEDETDQTPDPTGTPNANSNLTLDFGFIPLTSVGNYIWMDNNADGLQGADEAPLPGAHVELRNVDGTVARDYLGNPVAPQLTGNNGFYNFGNLLPGEYVVRVTPPDGFVPTAAAATADPDENPANDDSNGVPTGTGSVVESPAITLDVTTEPTDDNGDQLDPTGTTNANSNLTVDFGFVPLLSVGNYVWADANTNGVQDEGEVPLEGATVALLNADDTPAVDYMGQPIPSIVTGPEGFYNFGNLLPGDYKVRVVPPKGYAPTKTDADADPDSNSANDDSNGVPTGVGAIVESAIFTLLPGTEPVASDEGDQSDPFALPDSHGNLTIDFGFIPLVAVGNYVWEDLNANGIQDATEAPIAGVVVELLYADGTPAKDVNGALVPLQTTGDDGFYNFGELAPGDYVVRVIPTDGYRPTKTPVDADPDTNPANSDSNGVPTGQGSVVQSPVFTLAPGSEPIETDEADQAEPSDAPDHNSNLTVDFGFVPLVSLGNYVWSDLNADGLQDAGEPGIAGARVELLFSDGSQATDADGNPVVAVTTLADGLYHFGNLLPGNYLVQVTPPSARYQPTQLPVDPDPDTNPADNDSNGRGLVNSNTARSPVITLVNGGEPTAEGDADPSALPDANGNLTVDFGFVPLLQLGNRVWHDVNNSGQVDANESGIDGVTVQLFRAGDDPATATPVAMSVTAEGGYYLFSELIPGDYFVYIPVPPADYPLSSRPTVEEDNGVDNDDNGVQTSVGQPVRSPVITLTPDAEPTTDGDDAQGDLTIDFGFHELAQVGSLVWLDDNKNGVQDTGERGVAGVLVILFDKDGNQIAEVATDENGTFLFDNLIPGQYYIEFEAPDGYNFTVSTETQRNSDADPQTGRTPVFTLGPGTSDLTWWAGLIQTPTALDDTDEPLLSNKMFLPIIVRR